MPYYTYRCTGCDAVFEALVRPSDDAPACPQCGGAALERQMGAFAPAAKTPGLVDKARARAAREGHFSNYSRSEMKRK